tara:strand:+ start:17718 stop:20030 length:2313 start_codon:yes stop_codon:yes gene_type:complete
MNEVIIRIIDTANNVEGDLELASFNDFPLAITKGIVNLDNLKERTGTYTKTFKVPNTKNNANLLSSVDNINSRKDYRDALNRKPCIILVNDNPIEKGFLQVSKVYNGFNLDSFELVFFGNNIDWVKGAADLNVNSIPFTNSEQTYDLPSVKSINSDATNIANAKDFAYPYISRGGNQNVPKLSVNDFTPCFFLEKILLRGFNSLGYNINSTFLNTNSSKGLICDLNSEMRVRQSIIDDSKVKATRTTDLDINTNYNPSNTTFKLVFDDDSTGGNEDVNNVYNTTSGAYTADSTGTYQINLRLPHYITSGAFSTGYFYIDVKVGSSTDYLTTTLLTQFEVLSSLSPQLFNETFEVKLQQNDILSIHIYKFQFSSSGANFQIGSYTINSINEKPKISASRTLQIKEDDVFDVKDLIPDGLKLLDVLNDFTRMFNVYYWTDIKTKTVYFEPRDTFFKAQTEAIEWTDKLDIGNKYEVDYVSSYNRNIEFSYRDLDNDEWLKGWQDQNRRVYAQYKHQLPDRFKEGVTPVKLDLFSPSYAHVSIEAVSNEVEAFTSLKYWDEYINEGIPTNRINGYNPRIFNYKNGGQTNADTSLRKVYYTDNTNSVVIPYGIFEPYNNTYVGTGYNLSFTDSINTNGTTQKGLFSTYYSKMLKNIEEGGRLIAYFNLSSTDIENLDFRKLIYLDNDYDVRGYYLIESVIDYKPVQNGLTKVSLFKFENLGSVSIDGSQQGNNNVDTDDLNDDLLQPIYVEDGSQLIEVMIENPITGILEPVYK